MELPIPGQRWVSDTEPELGLGIILQRDFSRVELLFPAAGEHRQYALKTAPLRRVRFAEGDKIKTHEGAELVVASVVERAGLLYYHSGNQEIAEAQLSDTISFSKPEDRLFAGQTDELGTFALRVETLQRRARHRQSAARGFVGGRVDLIPHQLSIAGEVSGRLLPRVLLADEVGLGKTIEASLILHRLHLTGRADRVLILLPEPLVHQWFVELLRRFNLLFSIFDEQRCASIERLDATQNPFLDSQLVICPIEFLAGSPARAESVLAAGWDLLVVDEAHHLQWSPEAASPQYALVESLACATPGLLLLTATPQQLGPAGHFARLRLLDPDRYSELEAFLAEAGHYEEVATAVDRLLDGETLKKADQKLFAQKSARVGRLAADLAGGQEEARAKLVSALLDEFGIGRVMYRNTRAALTGFPQREPHLVPIAPPKGTATGFDAKVKWLAGLLKELATEKVLLICQTRALVERIHEALQRELNVPAALFHENLTLLQRDRNAAFFAEEEGARILLCSEIGSEGRNFQFAHHLVLFDLPEQPELLEQRIGRLDRIGQTATIRIWVPYESGTAEEVLARWYEEALNAFSATLPGGAELRETVGADLEVLLAGRFSAPKLTKLLAKSKTLRATITKKLERGHDRLLELHSSQPERAAELIRAIRGLDADETFESYFLRLLDHFGVTVEEHSRRAYILRPGQIITDAFTQIPEEGKSITFERAIALSREDLQFLSADHPLVRSTWDLLLSAENGNVAFGIWKAGDKEAIILEVYAVVECVAPAGLHVDRFLPPTPIRVAVDHALADWSQEETLLTAELEKGDIFRLLDRGAVKKKLLPAMFTQTQTLAAARLGLLVEGATAAMSSQLQGEIERLEALREVNNHVRPEEITALQEQKEALRAAIATARLRVDALRLVFRTA